MIDDVPQSASVAKMESARHASADGSADPSADASADPSIHGISSDTAALALVQQCAWTLVWVAVLSSALIYWGSWSAGAWAAVLAPILVLTALMGAILVWTVRRPLGDALQIAGMGAALVMAAVAEGTGIHLRHFYTTDSAAFNQVATRLLLDGHNPYTSSMSAAGRLLNPANGYWTYQVDGAHTLGVSYPAGSFLLQAPFMALGLNHMLSDWVDLGAWLVTVVLVFCMVPRYLRWLAPLLLLTGMFVGPFANGGTDALFVPFLVLAVWRWDQFPGRATTWLPAWVGPVSLGIACSVKQSPWFCVPFLLVGVAVESRRSGNRPLAVALRYLGLVVVAFAVINLPFFLWSPAAWIRGAFLPMVEPLVADGQGLVTLALHGLTGGVVLPWMSAAAALAMVAMLVAFARWEARLRRAWLFLVPLVLFLPDRSLTNYLYDFVPAALVAAVSVAMLEREPDPESERESERADHPRRWLAPLGIALPAVASAALLVVAFTSAPLSVAVDGVTAAGVATVDGGLHYVHVVVTVRNTSSSALTPRFMVSSGGGHPSGFWNARPVEGSVPVAPGATTRFVLRPIAEANAPPHGQWWIVEAYTTSPNALSTSSLQQWTLGKPGR